MKNITFFFILLISFTLNAQTNSDKDTLNLIARCQNPNVTYDVYCVALYPKQLLTESYVNIDSIELLDNHTLVVLYTLDNEMNLYIEYFVGYSIPYRIYSVYEYYDYNEANELLNQYKLTYPNAGIIKKIINYNN